ncbi:spore coat U domain-containing protein [Ectopseudomonas mendocina]|uniref:Spore coat U domain-containing protein n=1 Tax=Ectopseudomonas mendocina TaxID=300 RepID=A0ABZ2RLH3_ECTME
MKEFALKAIGLGAILLGSPVHASANNLAGEVEVKMVIGAGCSITNGNVNAGVNQWGTLDFGSHSELSNIIDAQTLGSSGNIQIKCSTGLSPSLSINSGLHSTGGQRYMKHATTPETIAYNVYSDATRNQLIQPDTPVNISAVATGNAVDIPLYGRVSPANQGSTSPAAGTYSDTLLVTISW